MRVEQSGPATCKAATNSGFVLVRVPVRVLGPLENVTAISRYQIGGMVGREVTWSPRGGQETTLTFRIPLELFRDRQHLTLEVLRLDQSTGRETLWARRYELHWASGAPEVEPIPDSNAGSLGEP